MKAKYITSKDFSQYGCIIDIDKDILSQLNIAMESISVPSQGNEYKANEEKLATIGALDYFTKLFGELQTQIGYCNGHNIALNALEYHKSSEIIVAITDLILLLGTLPIGASYHSDNLQAFYLKKGECIEMYATTLHFSPIALNQSGFKSIIVLPFSTNQPLESQSKNDKRLFAINKWMIRHKDFEKDGVESAILGKNYTINDIILP